MASHSGRCYLRRDVEQFSYLAQHTNVKYDWSNQTVDAHRVELCVSTPRQAMTCDTKGSSAT